MPSLTVACPIGESLIENTTGPDKNGWAARPVDTCAISTDGRMVRCVEGELHGSGGRSRRHRGYQPRLLAVRTASRQLDDDTCGGRGRSDRREASPGAREAASSPASHPEHAS